MHDGFFRRRHRWRRNSWRRCCIASGSKGLFGFAAGAIWLSDRGGFDARGIWWKRVLRFLLGVVGVGILYLGLSAVIPDQNYWVVYIASYLEFALIGLWISALAPLIFLRLNLVEPKIE